MIHFIKTILNKLLFLFLYSFRLQCLLLENNRSILEYNFIKMISYTKKEDEENNLQAVKKSSKVNFCTK